MSELEVASLITLLVGALPCYLLALYIEKRKHYSLFAGWDTSKISDENAYGGMLCTDLKSFSFVVALGYALTFFDVIGMVFFIACIIVLLIVPLVYYMLKVRKCYGK